MTTLFDVNLAGFTWLCARYAMLRTNYLGSLKDFLCLKKVKYSGQALIKGDIVIWNQDDNDDKPMNATLEIGADSIPISTRIKYDRHYGVMESKSLVSDIYYDENIPQIRVSRFNNLRKPNWFIRIR